MQVLNTGLRGLPGTNTWYFHEDGVSVADQVAALSTFYNHLATGITRAPLQYSFDGITEIVESSTGEIVGTDSTGAAWSHTATATGSALPFSTQGLLQLRTGVYFGGRELRGRIFLCGFVEDNSDEGEPVGALVSEVNGWAADLVDANLAVFSPSKLEFASVSAITMWTEWAVLRSRRD